MKKNERGKTFSHVKNEAADWRNGFVSSTFFCLWRETNDLKVTSLLSHVWKWRNFCTTLALCGAVGWARFCKSHMGNVYYFALNRSRYCVAVHTSRKKGKKGLRLILNSFGKETSFHGKSTWKHSSRKTVVKSFGSFNLVLTCVQIQHKSISVIPALILLEHWTSVFPALLHSEG